MAFNASLNVISSAFAFFFSPSSLSTGPKLYSVASFSNDSFFWERFTTDSKILFYCVLLKIRKSCSLMFSFEKWHKTSFFSNNKNTSILTYNTTLYLLSGPESRKVIKNVDLNILPKKTIIYYSWKPKSSILHNTSFSNLKMSFFLLACLKGWNCSTDDHTGKNRFYMKSLEYFSYWNLLYIYLTSSICAVRWVMVYTYTHRNFGSKIW